MASIIKVDTIQTAAGGTPTAADLGLNTTGTVVNSYLDTWTTQYSTTSSGGSELRTFTFTPKFADSILHIKAILHVGHQENTGAHFRLQRTISGSKTNLAENFGWVYHGNGNTNYSGSHNTMVYKDTPNTTTEITYHIDWWSDVNTAASYINRAHSNNTTQIAISAFEIIEIAG